MSNDLRRWINLTEVEIRMGLPQSALAEIETCLRAAHPVLIAAHKVYQRLAGFAPLNPEQQQRVERIVDVIRRLGQMDNLRPAPRVDLLDDVLTALSLFKLTYVPLQQVFVLPDDQREILDKARAVWTQSYTCFNNVTIND